MKKEYLFIAFILIISLFLCSCDKSNNNGSKIEKEKVDYSMYEFTDIRWIRDGEHDSEALTFHSDGWFSYSCGCGNPVNDSDLCEDYTYDRETNIIKLECLEEVDGTITTIKLVEYDTDTLVLDFDGDIRTFEKDID